MSAAILKSAKPAAGFLQEDGSPTECGAEPRLIILEGFGRTDARPNLPKPRLLLRKPVWTLQCGDVCKR